MEVPVKSAEGENHKEKKRRKRKQKEMDYKGDVDILNGAVVKKFSCNLAEFVVVCGIKSEYTQTKVCYFCLYSNQIILIAMV